MDDELVGAWRLVTFQDVDDRGCHYEGPLGPMPDGLLIYCPDGWVSVTMRRTQPSHPDEVAGRGEIRGPGTDYLSYAGTWRRRGPEMVHRIEVAPEAAWIGTDQVRTLRLDGGRLTLGGHGPTGACTRRVLSWQRLSPQ